MKPDISYFSTVTYVVVLILALSNDALSVVDGPNSQLNQMNFFKMKILIPLINGEQLAAKTAKGHTLNGSLVYFGAPWCRHSRQFNTTYQSLAKKSFAGLLPASPLFWYYEVKDPKKDQHHSYFRIKGFPTIIYIWKGMYWSFDGERNLHDIENWLEGIWTSNWRDGEPFPHSAPSLTEDIGSIVRDAKFFFKFHVNNHPIELIIGVLCVVGSFVAVLSILGIIVYDSVYIGWAAKLDNTNLDNAASLDDDEEGKLIKEQISNETMHKLIKSKQKKSMEEELKRINPSKYREYEEMNDISKVVGARDSSEEEVEESLDRVERVKQQLESESNLEGGGSRSEVRDRGKAT
jgi:thiol-disulfide isomerase/thioredoxin